MLRAFMTYTGRIMPKIQLKPRSPEFAEQGRKAKLHACGMPGCDAEGDHKAPKDRSLSEHYHFCSAHITEYNKAWDFFSGMHPQEVEDHMLRSLYGDRPTWRFDSEADLEDTLYNTAWQSYHFTDKNREREKETSPETSHNTPEFEALALMGLEPPVDLLVIKTRYKELAKKHHPDLYPDDPKAEELLKHINMAYTILKLAYENFEKIENPT